MNAAEQRLTSEVLKRRLIDSSQSKSMLNGDQNGSAFKVSHRSQDRGTAKRNSNSKKKVKNEIECFKCHEKGHKSFQCLNKKTIEDSKERNANVCQTEAFAMHAMAATNSDPLLNSWVIDSGATHHLTGARQHFKIFQESTELSDIVTAGDQRAESGGRIPVKNVCY